MNTSYQLQSRDSNSNTYFQKEALGFPLSHYQAPISEIIFITTYPPRECGIATYSQDLIKTLNLKFDQSFKIAICPIKEHNEQNYDGIDNKYHLNINEANAFEIFAKQINNNSTIKMVVIQHEFGLFKTKEKQFMQFLISLNKPVIIVFHTVLPNPDADMHFKVQQIAGAASAIVVMTNASASILESEYGIQTDKISVISHGTHLVKYNSKEELKKKYELEDRFVLSTFGLLSSGKNIETTLKALPSIIALHKNVLFLIIGKTHPSVIINEGEVYRDDLKKLIIELKLEKHVKFINAFLPLPELLDYLQLTDIYLFTSKDRNQAVSGTFSYAISCGCPIISTAIPHAREVLKNDAGIIIDFEDSDQLKAAILQLIQDSELRQRMSSNGLHKMAATAWENSAIAHAKLFKNISNNAFKLKYNMPVVNLDHIKKLTTDFGMIQFSQLNHPDILSGYTLDDNARALVALCQHYELTNDKDDLEYIKLYFNFIKFCLQTEGYFLNYVNAEKQFTEQNHVSNLADANGRAIWALGYLISICDQLPESEQNICIDAETIIQNAVLHLNKIHSTRAMAFVIKGLYYSNTHNNSAQNIALITGLANRLVQMYKHESDAEWHWFESYLTYANGILPEAMLCAYLATGELIYQQIAKASFDFLLCKSFNENGIKVISNKGWLYKGRETDKKVNGGEQPIDVAYTILALSKFYAVFKEESYKQKMETSMNWFMGHNHLSQVIYNPCTGGCYDGLEDNYVNLNQGAESAVSYLMARLTFERPNTNLKYIPLPISVELMPKQIYNLSILN